MRRQWRAFWGVGASGLAEAEGSAAKARRGGEERARARVRAREVWSFTAGAAWGGGDDCAVG